MNDTFDRLAAATGVSMPVAVLSTFALGSLLSSTYAWPTDPFSVIGAEGGLASLAFNGGLVVAGLLAIPFAVRCFRDWSRTVGACYALAGVSLSLAGVFPMGSGLHAVAAGFFLFAWVAPTAGAVVDWRAGRRRDALVGVALGQATVCVWFPYDFGWEWAVVGYGFAELVVVLAFGTWSAWSATRRWRGSTTATTRATGVTDA